MTGNQKQIRFPPFRLDCPEQRLYRDENLIPLRAKSFEVLQYLSERPGRLVSKNEILDAIWADTTVTDTVLKVCIREIREVLGDNAANARFIETAHRRGYRFIAPIDTAEQELEIQLPRTKRPPSSAPFVVGRDEEIATLERWRDKANSGERQLILVTGEAGIGKTTLAQAFLDRAEQTPGVLITRGQCLEQYGSSEAYLPLLEAMSRLCREPESKSVLTLFRRHAPTWVAQIPWLIGEERQSLQSEILGATRERMLREMADAIDVITYDKLLIILLEDLHWSDYSTLDLITYLARRAEPARLMVLGTYRPADVAGRHPLQALKQELMAHHQCVQLQLALLSERAVADHLTARFPNNQFPHELARSIHQRTDGNPMFVMHLVDFFLQKGLIARLDDKWLLTESLDQVEVGMPDNIRQIIDKQLDSLSTEDQRVLETAAVAGAEFSTAIIAATLEQDHLQLETTCETLARRQLFIRSVGPLETPRGEMSARYRFIHALYQSAIYDRVPLARRAHLHRKLAEQLETVFDEDAAGQAAELAMHFEKARDYRSAASYLQRAAQNATERSAHREAESLSRKGLELLAKTPDKAELIQLELLLQTHLAVATSATRGYGASEVEKAYSRARELCSKTGDTFQLAPVLWGLWRFYLIRSRLQVAHELALHLLEFAQSTHDAATLVGAHLALGTTFDNLGDFESAVTHFDLAASSYDPAQQNTHLLLYGHDPNVVLRSFKAWAVWSLGYPDEALAIAKQAITLAEELRHPETLCFALFFTAWAHQLRGEPAETLIYARRTIDLAEKNGMAQWTAFGSSLHGWALAQQGQIEAGIDEMRGALAKYSAIGSEISRPHFLGLLAEALLAANRNDEALIVISDALKLVADTSQRYYESELLRLKGVVVVETGDVKQATRCFEEAIEVAQKQKARSFELRARESLSPAGAKSTK